MKTVMLLLALIAGTTCWAQQKSHWIDTDEGPLLVQYNKEGLPFIDFDLKHWQEIFGTAAKEGEGTDILTVKVVSLCIKIASRKKNCEGGIGFRCFKSAKGCWDVYVIVRQEEAGRFVESKSELLLKENKVRMTFLQKVDWNHLAKS